jgi:hypothetical protein
MGLGYHRGSFSINTFPCCGFYSPQQFSVIYKGGKPIDLFGFHHVFSTPKE